MHKAIWFVNKSFVVFSACLIFASVIVSSLGQPKDALASNPVSPWLASSPPTLKNLKENVPANQIPGGSGYGCLSPKKFIIKPAKAPSILLPLGQSEVAYLSCGTDTSFGTIDNNINLTRTGTNLAGPVYNSAGVKIKLYPIPHSNSAFTLDNSAGTGNYITFQRNITQRLTTEVNKITGEVKHKLTDGPSQLIKDELSSSLPALTSTGGFSGNGKWLVFDAPFIGLTRLNVDTGEILIFAAGYKYNIGLDPSLQMAVSADGRYAAVQSFTFSTFKIYDLDTCVKAVSPNKPAVCQYRDLKAVLQNAMPDHTGLPDQINFTDDYALKFYGMTIKNGVRTKFLQLLTADGQTPVQFAYLALGDSFASGEGAREYRPGTDVKSPKNKCHLSSSSYPYLIGNQLGLNGYESVACSGAMIKDIDGQGVKNDSYNDESQADGLKDPSFDDYILNNSLPDYRMQKDFVGKYKPDKITISIGGNDMGFSDIVRNCVFWADDCYSQPVEKAALVKKINDQYDGLVDMYNQLENSSPGTTIYVVGYPKVVNPDEVCDTNVHASAAELKLFDGLVTYIDSVIHKAADKAGVYYVDVSDALIGNRLCEANGHEPAVNGLTAGDDKIFDIGPIGNESYHPNALGHSLLEQAILDKTANFTAQNPYPNLSITNPTLADARDFIKTSAYDLLDTHYFDKNMFNSWWNKNEPQLLNEEGFAPNSTVTTTLTSDPVTLGAFSADSNGSVNTSLTLPDSIPVGYHTVHVSGQNVAGENIEYQQEVFVTSSENDFDGDGIANEQDPCVAIEPSGIDYDQDGVDDACDGQIGEPPVAPPADPVVILPSDELPIAEPDPIIDPLLDPGLPEADTSSNDSADAGIIGVVDYQNQNVTYGEAPSTGLLQQGQVAVVPSSSSDGLQGTGASLFGNTSDASSLLNQSQVLGTSSSPASTTTQPAENSGGLPVFSIVVALVLLIGLVWFFRQRDSNNNTDED